MPVLFNSAGGTNDAIVLLIRTEGYENVSTATAS